MPLDEDQGAPVGPGPPYHDLAAGFGVLDADAFSGRPDMHVEPGITSVDTKNVNILIVVQFYK